MAREFAKGFYGSRQWKKLREEHKRKVGGLCERCLKEGIYTAGVIVHHIEHVSPDNIGDPKITISHDNLMLVCKQCHEELHTKDKKKTHSRRRWTVDENGKISPRCAEK